MPESRALSDLPNCGGRYYPPLGKSIMCGLTYRMPIFSKAMCPPANAKGLWGQSYAAEGLAALLWCNLVHQAACTSTLVWSPNPAWA